MSVWFLACYQCFRQFGFLFREVGYMITVFMWTKLKSTRPG